MFASDTDPSFAPFLLRDYPEMSRRCNIVSDEQLWSVNGQVWNGDESLGGGVLAWAYDALDAEHIAKRMCKDDRFKNVSYNKC